MAADDEEAFISGKRSPIHLRMFSGKPNPNLYCAKNTKYALGMMGSKVSEFNAIKEGKSVYISPGDDAIQTCMDRFLEGIDLNNKETKEEGVVDVFIRDSRWLKSRRIIGEDGKIWTPESKPVRDVIDLTSD